MQNKGWEGFVPGKWSNDEVDVRDFIQRNYTPYEGGRVLSRARDGGDQKALGHRSRPLQKGAGKRAAFWTRTRRSSRR